MPKRVLAVLVVAACTVNGKPFNPFSSTSTPSPPPSMPASTAAPPAPTAPAPRAASTPAAAAATPPSATTSSSEPAPAAPAAESSANASKPETVAARDASASKPETVAARDASPNRRGHPFREPPKQKPRTDDKPTIRCPHGYKVIKSGSGLACQTPNSGGKGDGEACTFDSDCHNNSCLFVGEYGNGGGFRCSLTGSEHDAVAGECALGETVLYSRGFPVSCQEESILCKKGRSVFGVEDPACPKGNKCSQNGVCFEASFFPKPQRDLPRGERCYVDRECASNRCQMIGVWNVYGHVGECK